MVLEDTQKLIDRLLDGDFNAVPRLITLIEKGSDDVPAIMESLPSDRLGRAKKIGITGPPGAGKSTLVESITSHLRKDNLKVGILVIDPSSPFTGGAILGDRVRMSDHYLDEGVFIRSMATRGAPGGLSEVVPKAIKILDASGFDVILLETAGVGQTELDVKDVVDTVTVVLVPEAGDAIQTMKAGLMEIADIFVVNKSDRSGSKRMASDLSMNVHLGSKNDWWETPVLLTQVHRGVGVKELIDAFEGHRKTMEDTNNLEPTREKQRRRELEMTIRGQIFSRIKNSSSFSQKLTHILDQVDRGELDPSVAANALLRDQDLLAEWLNPQGPN